MKMLPFNLRAVEDYNWPVVTRDGRRAEIVQTDAEHDYIGRNQPLRVKIYSDDGLVVIEGYFFANGAYWDKEDANDLFLSGETGHLWEVGTEVRFKPGVLEELDRCYDPGTDSVKDGGSEGMFYVPSIFHDRLKVGIINGLNKPWEEFGVIAYYIDFGPHCWIIPQTWLQCAALTEPVRDIPGYTDTYVSGDEFLKIIRACSGDHL